VTRLFNFFSMVFGSLGGILVYLFGGFDAILKSLIVLIVFDYITGVLKAIYDKKLSSIIGWKGIIKKIFTLIVVSVSVVLQSIINLPVREITIMFFIANESISVLENISTVIPVPSKLKIILQQLKDDNIAERIKEEESEEDED